MDTIRTAEDILSEKGGELIGVAPETTIRDALAIMNERRIGALLVKREGAIVGIWTERDLMRNVVSPGFDPATARIGDHMTSTLVSVPHDAPLHNLVDKILGLRVRHLLVEREGAFIGILSSGDVLRAAFQLQTEQLEALGHIVDFEYYDEWRWKQKRRK